MIVKGVWKRFLAIKTILTIWYIVILCIVLVALSSVLYLNMKKKLYEEVENFLYIEAQQISVESNLKENMQDRLKPEDTYTDGIIKHMADKGVYVAFYDVDGKMEFRNLPDSIMPDKIKTVQKYSVLQYNENNWAVITMPRKKDEKVIGWIRLSRSLKSEDQTLMNLLTILYLGVPVTLVLASLGGYILARKALKPIDAIATITQKISHSNLSRRIERRYIDDEIGRLTDTLNGLLDRLESAFERQKQFTTDASHELRTPISVIRAQAEEALGKTRTVEEYRKALEEIKKQTEHMSSLIGQLLLLARSDRRQNQLQKEEFNLVDVITAVAEEMQLVANQKDILIHTVVKKDKIIVFADQSQIIQLLLNLLDNGIEYTPENGTIVIRMKQIKDMVRIDVIDNGIGIPEEHQNHIFKRFYRVDKARSRSKGGAGLGLSICQWIATTHGGQISVKSKVGKGTMLTVYLPLT